LENIWLLIKLIEENMKITIGKAKRSKIEIYYY
jgi:hypothetical protein